MHYDIPPGVYDVDLFDCPTFKMFHWHDCPRAQDILKYKSFEPMSMKLWCELVKDAEVIIDVGAHVGVYSLVAAALRHDIIIDAFEPNPDCYARLVLHCNMNEFVNLIPYRNAIATKEEVVALNFTTTKGDGYLQSGSQLGPRPKGRPSWGEVYVRTEHLSVEWKTLIKIDVEDAERMVFEGMTGLENKPHILLETFSQENADYITGVTKPHGYRYHLIHEDTMELEPMDRLIACDPKGKNFNQYLEPI
jgi:FkbM family methyltransferase